MPKSKLLPSLFAPSLKFRLFLEQCGLYADIPLIFGTVWVVCGNSAYFWDSVVCMWKFCLFLGQFGLYVEVPLILGQCGLYAEIPIIFGTVVCRNSDFFGTVWFVCGNSDYFWDSGMRKLRFFLGQCGLYVEIPIIFGTVWFY